MQKSAYDTAKARLTEAPRTWVITGVAGFIGSNLAETLLNLDQRVIGLDNFATGYRRNLTEIAAAVGKPRFDRFTFIEGDIRDYDTCRKTTQGADHVTHQAALGSVPRSLADPATTNAVNIGGHLNMMMAAREASVKSFVYAASSSTYGDHPALPKIEGTIGAPLSPYAVTKFANELYANVFALNYGFKATGLRYFNVFGARQDPGGAYAAVIPKWTAALLRGEQITIHGDGETSRDFCYIDNAVQANILAAVAGDQHQGAVYNVAFGGRTTLTELAKALAAELGAQGRPIMAKTHYGEFRPGDVRHSQADIAKAKTCLGYAPSHDILAGLRAAMPWYISRFESGETAASATKQ